MSKLVEITRMMDDGHVTQGRLTVNGEFVSYTIERSWNDNQPGVSCIPVGTYRLKQCETSRTMPSQYRGVTYEVVDVPGRTHIKFHVLNYAHQSEGCIGPNTSVDSDSGAGGKSTSATLKFMLAMNDIEEATLIVRSV